MKQYFFPLEAEDLVDTIFRYLRSSRTKEGTVTLLAESGKFFLLFEKRDRNKAFQERESSIVAVYKRGVSVEHIWEDVLDEAHRFRGQSRQSATTSPTRGSSLESAELDEREQISECCQ